jgi:hypothetical protein
MESDNTLETRLKRGPIFRVQEDHDGARPGAAPSRQTTQAERSVMHPDREDVEWRYWRGGWGRLTE